MEKVFKRLICLWMTAAMITILSVVTYADQTYVHDPMDNPNAAKDIVVDPDAVYGYAPSPDSERLKDFVDLDWTDETIVEEMKQEREAYHESLKELYDMIDSMRSSGNTTEEIARAVSTRRNELRLEAYKDDPEGLEMVKKSNLENYGNENGGTPDFFFEKYGSWETVIEKALSTNAGADACLGLYDKYYDTYFIKTDNVYTVQPGDCLMSIAEKQLGDKNKWQIIYDLNSSIISNPNLIYPGQVLTIGSAE